MGWLDRINNAIVDYATRQQTASTQAAKAAPAASSSQDQMQQSLSAERSARTSVSSAPKLPLTHYKSSVGQDLTFVKETLRHKIAEYGLNPGIQLQLKKPPLGQVEVEGGMPENTRSAITRDLNQNQGFVDAMSRLSVGQPTLRYVDNVTKLSQAYGTGNTLFQSLVSRDNSANGLRDIAERFNNLRDSQAPGASASGNDAFQLNFNATA